MLRTSRSWDNVRLFTIGHSTRTLDDLVSMLASFSVVVLVDVRTIPRSRKNPQFNAESLPASIEPHGLDYLHLPKLGGLRRPAKDSVTTGWHNDSFRGFADYMQSPTFEAGLEELHAATERGLTAIMCAEAVPWRCHRSLIADALTARGAVVEHIMSLGHANRHTLKPFAKVDGQRVTYPAP
jgi:uncharacterized protein (DUF488 family)